MYDVQTLVLDNNAISNWRSLRPLYHMANLKCLSLSDNCIKSIPAEELSEGMLPVAGYDCALCITCTCLGHVLRMFARHHQRYDMMTKQRYELMIVKLVQG